MNPTDTSDLVRRARNGDRQAQADLLTAFRGPLLGQVRRYLHPRNPSDLEDVVQDIFVKVIAHLHEFDEGRGVKFSTWVFTFVRNHCLDQLKRKRHATVSIHVPAREDAEGGDEWLGQEDPPERELLRREFRRALRQALGALPAELADIFALRELQGLEFHMIAKRLRLPLGTVKSKHYRAIDRLRFSLRSFRLAAA